MADLQITQVRSVIGATQKQRRTLASLGLRRIRHSVTVPDRPEMRGMIAGVAHLVEVGYAADGEVLDLEAGQTPKGVGNPPAGPSVADDEAAEAAHELEEALAEPGSVGDIGDLVDNPPTLQTTDAPIKPKPRGTALDDEAGGTDGPSAEDTRRDQVIEDVDDDGTAPDGTGPDTAGPGEIGDEE